MAADAKLNRLLDRRDAIDATIADIEAVGIAKAGFDGLQEVTNIEIERLQKQRDELNRRIAQRMAYLNGRNPFLMGTLTRSFKLPGVEASVSAPSRKPFNPVHPRHALPLCGLERRRGDFAGGAGRRGAVRQRRYHRADAGDSGLLLLRGGRGPGVPGLDNAGREPNQPDYQLSLSAQP